MVGPPRSRPPALAPGLDNFSQKFVCDYIYIYIYIYIFKMFFITSYKIIIKTTRKYFSIPPLSGAHADRCGWGANPLSLQLSHLVVIITSYRREVQMFRKAQWIELYSTHAKSQWVERFVHRIKTSFWMRSSTQGGY
jgi:hypothetical protein